MQSQTHIPYTQMLSALEELQARPQWVCWRKEEQREGTFTKVSYNARTGHRAASDNPATWASYGQAVQALRAGTYHGLGYMFRQDYTGIDLDHCVNPDGSTDAWAQAYLERLRSYAEYSPSTTGIHILVRGAIPRGTRRRIPDAPHPEAAIEMYCEKRYFTVTGQHLAGTPTTIETCADLQAIHAELTLPKPAPQPERCEQPEEFSDSALLERAMNASNGATFRALWDGATTSYVSQSEAELALCNLLAFWTGKDASRMDRLFRHSALYRQKWDQPARTGERYGEGTIARANFTGGTTPSCPLTCSSC
jgi:putative DNA primase/helicase